MLLSIFIPVYNEAEDLPGMPPDYLLRRDSHGRGRS